MSRGKHSEAQIIGALKQVEAGRATEDVARELGINETSLGNWVRAYRQKHAGDEPPLQGDENHDADGSYPPTGPIPPGPGG